MEEKTMSEIEYLTVKQVCDIIPLGKSTIYKIFHLDGFPAVKIGRRYMVEKSELMEWIKSREGKQVIING
jgi:excisionase family DNA binding protein